MDPHEPHHHVVILFTLPDTLWHRMPEIHEFVLALQSAGAELNICPDPTISCEDSAELSNVRNWQAWRRWSPAAQRTQGPRRQGAHEEQVTGAATYARGMMR